MADSGFNWDEFVAGMKDESLLTACKTEDEDMLLDDFVGSLSTQVIKESIGQKDETIEDTAGVFSIKVLSGIANSILDDMFISTMTFGQEMTRSFLVEKEAVLSGMKAVIRYNTSFLPPVLPTTSVSLPNSFNRYFSFIVTTGDGSCFFNAVSIVLSGSENLSSILRLLVACELLGNGQNYTKISEKDFFAEVESTLLLPKLRDYLGLDFNVCFSSMNAPMAIARVLQRPVVIFQRLTEEFLEKTRTMSYAEVCRKVIDGDFGMLSIGWMDDEYSDRDPVVIYFDFYMSHYTAVLKKYTNTRVAFRRGLIFTTAASKP